MAFGLPLSLVPVLMVILALGLAALFTRVWVNDSRVRARRELQFLGLRPGRAYKLGGAWTLRAAREPQNLLLAVLAAGAWIAVVISLQIAR